MDHEFPNRSSNLFGRNSDLSYLLGRAKNKGITVVAGRSQMGKSWLLTELSRRLSASSSQYLVGFTESLGETSDLLLRAVVDLYTRWLSDSTYWEQAQVSWQQQKKDLVSNVGKAFGTIVEKISKLGSKPVEAVAGLVKETFEGLASANRDLLTGGIQLPRLQIEQARELLALVSRIAAGRQLVLVMDQWEKSPAIELETNILDAFVRHLDEWPLCHIFLGVRSEEKPLRAVEQLRRDSPPGAVEIHDLPPMRLEGSASGDLIQYVRKRVPAAAGFTDQELLEMIAGYPGTVSRWTSPYAAETVRSDELKALADDANAYRFGEFKVVVPTLSDGERRLAMRLALLPLTGSEGGWKALHDVVLQGSQSSDLDALKRKKLLDASPPPSYGHAKRREAALQCFTDDYREELREKSEFLIFTLGSRVDNTASGVLPFVSTLITLLPIATELNLPSLPQAVCRIALSLTGIQTLVPETLISAVGAAGEDGTQAAVAPLLAMGLCNTLVYAKQEKALQRRDALLDELRQLARTYPDDAGVRGPLATGLYNTLNHAKQEEALQRRDALLDELRQLARTYPDDAAMRGPLAKSLYNTLNEAKQEEALQRRDALLDELRQLGRTYPDDAAVRGPLAKSLNNTIS